MLLSSDRKNLTLYAICFFVFQSEANLRYSFPFTGLDSWSVADAVLNPDSCFLVENIGVERVGLPAMTS